jgi:L-alanine-DL-glutamate epimerase-like enolase superfamily enzyme
LRTPPFAAPQAENGAGDAAGDDLRDLGPLAAVFATVASPAARFALETALLSAVAAAHGASLASLLGAHTGVVLAPVPVAIVVDTPAQAVAAVAAIALAWWLGQRLNSAPPPPAASC